MKFSVKFAALLLLLGSAISCSTQEEVQDAFTSESNYFDYEYYDDDISNLDTFDSVYDYPYYEEPEYFYDTPAPPPVILEEAPEEDGSSWFFEDY